MPKPSINGIRILQWIEIMGPNLNQLQFLLRHFGKSICLFSRQFSRKTKTPVPNGTGALHYLSK
jgi:hypothetical protein